MNGPLPTRLFSLREANALVVTLQEQFERARELRDQLGELQAQLSRSGHPVERPEIDVDPTAPAGVQGLQSAAIVVIEQLRGILREVSELGVEVKAADGLVDFRSKLRGRTVYLCWRYGEDRIDHWHELDTGFGGRKPLAAADEFTGDLLH